MQDIVFSRSHAYITCTNRALKPCVIRIPFSWRLATDGLCMESAAWDPDAGRAQLCKGRNIGDRLWAWGVFAEVCRVKCKKGRTPGEGSGCLTGNENSLSQIVFVARAVLSSSLPIYRTQLRGRHLIKELPNPSNVLLQRMTSTPNIESRRRPTYPPIDAHTPPANPQ